MADTKSLFNGQYASAKMVHPISKRSSSIDAHGKRFDDFGVVSMGALVDVGSLILYISQT